MKTVNIHEAKTQLSKLIDEAVSGEAFIVAKAGKPMVEVRKLDAPAPRRVGFLAGQGRVPADFDDMAADEIAVMFCAEDGPAA